MPSCNLCGKETELVTAIIEGTELKVCNNCARHGKVLRKPQEFTKRVFIQKKEIEYNIVENYAELIRKKREKLQLTQEDFSKKLNERLSIMQKIENSQMKPPIGLAKKLEKELDIKLLEEVKESSAETTKEKKEAFTIGDFIKVRKR